MGEKMMEDRSEISYFTTLSSNITMQIFRLTLFPNKDKFNALVLFTTNATMQALKVERPREGSWLVRVVRWLIWDGLMRSCFLLLKYKLTP